MLILLSSRYYCLTLLHINDNIEYYPIPNWDYIKYQICCIYMLAISCHWAQVIRQIMTLSVHVTTVM